MRGEPQSEPDLNQMTKAQLLDLAGELGLQIKSSSRKADIIQSIEEADHER